MSDIIKHKSLCEQMHETYKKKNADYGNSFEKSIELWGMSAAGVRISDKYNRFVRLCSNEAKVKDESVVDTLMDMANYCLLTVMALERRSAEYVCNCDDYNEGTCKGLCDEFCGDKVCKVK